MTIRSAKPGNTERRGRFLLGLLWFALLVMPAVAKPVLKEVPNPALGSGYHEFTVPRPDGSEIHGYLNGPPSGESEPLVVYLDGSGCNSAFFLGDDGRVSDTNYGVLADLVAPPVRVLAVEKRGVPFGHRGHGGTGRDCPDEYTAHATRDERVGDVVTAVRALEGAGLVSGPLLLVGHSEGADVAAGAAEALPEVTHVGFLAGGGPTQIFDMVTLTRKEMGGAGRTPADIEVEVEKQEGEFREILADPTSTTRFYAGHAYLRWSSYIRKPPMDSLLRAHAHIYVVHGTEDKNVPIESADMLVAQLILNGRKDVTVRRLPGANHALVVGAPPANASPLEPVFKDVLDWAGIRRR